jgi:hypothetical protein
LLLKLCKTYSDWSGEALVSCIEGLLPNVSMMELKVKYDSPLLNALQIGFYRLSFERNVSLIIFSEKSLSDSKSLLRTDFYLRIGGNSHQTQPIFFWVILVDSGTFCQDGKEKGSANDDLSGKDFKTYSRII